MSELILNVSFVDIVKVEDTTSISFPRYQNNKNFKYVRTLGVDETQERHLAFIRFKNLWLDHDFPSDIAWDVRQWVMEEGRKALDKLGKEVQDAVNGYRNEISDTVRARVNGYGG